MGSSTNSKVAPVDLHNRFSQWLSEGKDREDLGL